MSNSSHETARGSDAARTVSARPDHVVLAMTGASGSAYAVRLAQVLLGAGVHLHLVISSAARQVLDRELQLQAPASASRDRGQLQLQWLQFLQTALKTKPASEWGFRDIRALQQGSAAQLHIHETQDYSAGIASGSFRTRGMIICPCSIGTLSSLASGASSNLIQRAAEVHMKERRPLIVVPRETPLGLIALENMVRLTHAGATILPSMPGFYHQPGSIGDLVDFIVARICDHLQIDHTLMKRWGESD
jgi:flavin prenyltransferase